MEGVRVGKSVVLAVAVVVADSSAQELRVAVPLTSAVLVDAVASVVGMGASGVMVVTSEVVTEEVVELEVVDGFQAG